MNIQMQPTLSMQAPRRSMGVRQARSISVRPEADSLRFGSSTACASVSLIDPSVDIHTFKAAVDEKLRKVTPETRSQVIGELTDVLDLYLQDRWAEENIRTQGVAPTYQPGKRGVSLWALNQLMGPRGEGNMVMAQINPVAGDVRGNALKIMNYIKYAEAIGVDSVVFPEMSLMGYPIRDVITRHPGIVDENIKWLKAIAKSTGKTRVVVGFVEPRKAKAGDKLIGKPFYNAMAIMGNGEIEGITRKTLLPNYGEFDDWRTFESSPLPGVHPPDTLCDGTWGFEEYAQNSKGTSFINRTINTIRRFLQKLVNFFKQGSFALPAEIHKRKYGMSICEDTWNDHEFMTNPLYANDPMVDVGGGKNDVIINISASPSRGNKAQLKHNMLSHMAEKYKKPYVYVNQCGAIDEVSFDGASMVFNAEGKLVARAKSFQEQFMVVNPLKGEGQIHDLTESLEETKNPTKIFDPYNERDMKRVYSSIVQGIRDYFEKRSYPKMAVLGLSGGLDSAISATLLADALGPENVIGIRMSNKLITSSASEDEAQELARNLGIHLVDIPITDTVTAFEWSQQPAFEKLKEAVKSGNPNIDQKKIPFIRSILEKIGKAPADAKVSETIQPDEIEYINQILTRDKGKSSTYGNLQARSRMVNIYGVANEMSKELGVGVIPIATSDKSELYQGYASIGGDMLGELAPIADLTKCQVRQLGRWMNQNRRTQNAIPAHSIEKPSGAELEFRNGKVVHAEDDLPPYEFADEVIWRMERLGQGKPEMMKEKFWYEDKLEKEGKSLGAEEKDKLIDKFFKRAQISVIKWWLAPPSIIVSGGGSITKSDYREPITSRGEKYMTRELPEINQILAKQTHQLAPMALAG